MLFPLRFALGVDAPTMLDMNELDGRWRHLTHVETGLSTSSETGAALASAVARQKWMGTGMDAAREPLRRWEIARDDWRASKVTPDLASLGADLLHAESIAKRVSGYAPPLSRDQADEIAGAERSAFATATFARIQNRWRWLVEWINGEEEPADPVRRAAWRTKALERAKGDKLLRRWLEFETRWIAGEAKDEEIFTEGYHLDLGVAEKRASEKGYGLAARLEPADRLIPHPEEMPGPKVAKESLDEALKIKDFVASAPEGVAEELIPDWIRPYLKGAAFLGGLGGSLALLEKVDKLGGAVTGIASLVKGLSKGLK